MGQDGSLVAHALGTDATGKLLADRDAGQRQSDEAMGNLEG